MRFFTPFLFLLLSLIAFPENGNTSELAEGPPLSLIQRAEQGDADAQLNLSVMYANGRGVPQDYKEAYAWFNVAAAKGNKYAARNTDRAARQLDPKTLSEAQALSRTYFNKYR